jgi:3-oxoacyl-[acyl-carrier protein] reductase
MRCCRRCARVVGLRRRRGSYTVVEPVSYLQASNVHRPGLVAAFKTLAREVVADGVTINHVHSTPIVTDRMLAVGKLGMAEPEDYPLHRMDVVNEVTAAAFLCSERASYKTGTSLVVDGGLSQALS